MAAVINSILFVLLVSSQALAQVYTDQLNVDNVRIDGNTISTLDTNGNLLLDFNGTGKLELPDLGASTVPYLDSNKRLTSSSVTPTELGRLSGVGSALCGISDTCTLTNKTFDADGTGNSITNIENADIKAAAGIVDTKLATISTAGKVSNSATTATSANTASAIVARDGSGNFSAGTITAGLTGNVTGNVTGNLTGNVTGSVTGSVTGNADTATALAANPADCASDTYATTIAASGALTCSTVTNAGLAGSISDSKLSTISTAGKVSNSATTATSANTASAIVARDSSGNFSAGTITAALTGNVTGNVTGAVTGNADTATALASNPSDCSANTYATTIAANGNLTCASITNASTTAASANTASAIVARDSSGNFSAGTITAALTGEASGNTKYTANNHGVVISGSANTMTVIAPDASTTKVLTSAGTGADPVWADVASAPTSAYDFQNCGLASSVASSAWTMALKQGDGTTNPSSGTSACKIAVRGSTATDGLYNVQSITAAQSIVVPNGATLGLTSGRAEYVWIYEVYTGSGWEMGITPYDFGMQGIRSTTAIDTASDAGDVMYTTNTQTSKPYRKIGLAFITPGAAGAWTSNATNVWLMPIATTQGESYCATLSDGAFPHNADIYGDLTSIVLGPGSWDISYHVAYHNTNTTTTTRVITFVGTVSGNDGTGLNNTTNGNDRAPVPNNNADRYNADLGGYRVNVSNTTTYYLKALASTSKANLSVGGTICGTRAK